MKRGNGGNWIFYHSLCTNTWIPKLGSAGALFQIKCNDIERSNTVTLNNSPCLKVCIKGTRQNAYVFWAPKKQRSLGPWNTNITPHNIDWGKSWSSLAIEVMTDPSESLAWRRKCQAIRCGVPKIKKSQLSVA